MKKIYIILICILISSPVAAEMYGWVDKNGIKHFSDSPPTTIEQDVAVWDKIESSAIQQQNHPQKDDDQPSDTPSITDKEITNTYKRANLRVKKEREYFPFTVNMNMSRRSFKMLKNN